MDPAAQQALLQTRAVIREGLDAFGRLAQLSTLALLVSLAIVRQLTSAKASSIKHAPKSKPVTILGEPLPAALLVPFWVLSLVLVGVFYIPQSKPSFSPLAYHYIYLTRLPVHLLASLLPFHVLLANNFALNPLPWLLSLSRPSLTPYHRVLGWTFMLLFATHGSMYMNFYVQNGLLVKRVQDLDVQLGMALSTTFSGVAFAARKSFRVRIGKSWIWAHISAATLIGGLLWGHVTQTRVYVLQAAAVAAVGVGWRAFSMLSGSHHQAKKVESRKES